MPHTVHLFARARELAGADSVAVELPPGSTVAALHAALAVAYPAMASLLDRSAIAVNHDSADAGQVIDDGDEIAVIPPVSGG
jgi:molybdopterin converting factor subunit 1